MRHLNNLYTARDYYIIIYHIRMPVRKKGEQRGIHRKNRNRTQHTERARSGDHKQ